MSVENLPERGIHPVNDIVFMCPNDHPMLLRLFGINKVILGGFITTYPWIYEGPLTVGSVKVLDTFTLLSVEDAKKIINCPHCPDKNTFDLDISKLLTAHGVKPLKIRKAG